MQLNLTPPLVVRTFGANFNQILSATFTGLTVAGTCSAVVFNFAQAQKSLGSAFDPLKKVWEASFLSSGINKLGDTFNSWAQAIFGSKDDFRSWLQRYLGIDGVKSGVSELYHKLVAWATIVYEWFRDKFIKFIGNIPDMVKNWDKLRLSLFKWGTFLGGGGGSALWAMFGSGDNWGKLADLIGNPEFEGVVDKFSKLVEENGAAFSEMNEEEAKEMFEAILDDPKEAEALLGELLDEQKEKNEKKKEELKKEGKENEEPKEELEKEEIVEKFKNSGGGSPNNPTEAFGDMVGSALQGMVDISPTKLWDTDIAHTAKTKMKEYIDTLRKDVEKKARKSDVKQKFLDAIKDNETAFILSLAEAAKKAFEAIKKPSQQVKYEDLAKKFGEILEEEFTVEATDGDGEEGISIREKVPSTPPKKSRK
ncbi:hypothetical protein A6V39_00645 [Candidatus Mycoplasma haematobovis]|uniref:Uncharacterized protein n=1 Tax=Candidatus Mycoplasma haematobovis TaxID=432608 RepID=A0A1A9QFR8_9MOLU|nr:hypothetical protein [Candidatus Mycoplasma haematobovis]OAL10559.1 hypothetical protein A6V39_00645 [Candidatus Mycoplasma haematobovis]